MESIGLDQIPLLVQSKSGESPVNFEVTLKQKIIGLARLASLVDFCWTSNGSRASVNWKECHAECHQRTAADPKVA